MVTQRSIEDVIFELLAEQSGGDPQDLRRELELLGDDMPVDSVLAAEVLADVEETFGVSIPITAEIAKSLQSVRGFATAVLSCVELTDRQVGEGA